VKKLLALLIIGGLLAVTTGCPSATTPAAKKDGAADAKKDDAKKDDAKKDGK
jgi:hypothetical protein